MFNIKCPKCKNKTVTIDLDRTFKLYNDCFESQEIIFPHSVAPEVTRDVVVSCVEPNCDYSNCEHYSDFMEKVIQDWADTSWKVFLKDFGETFSYENYFTRYLVDKDLKTIVSQKDIDNNPIIKELIKYIEKKSNK